MTTSLLRNSPQRNQDGFTLVEILIVLAIVALIVAMGIPAINQIVSQRLNSTARKFVGTIRTIRNDSILLNNIYRLTINIDDQTWWVETQTRAELLSTDPEEEPETNEEGEILSNFAYAEKFSKKPISLPGGVEFAAVEKEREGLLTEGLAYIHFFPNGYSERSLILLVRGGKEKNGYALALRPTGGTVDIYPENLDALLRRAR